MDLVVNLNKPKNISSQQAVIKVKRIFAARKAGHTGTLDPIATGILIVCINDATKITRFLSDLDKEYIVRLKLGERTDTYDLTGKFVEIRDFSSIKEYNIHKVLEKFTGKIKQIPPMYSAIKVHGQPLYKLARSGIEIKRPERIVNIFRIDPISFKQPYLDIKVSCSKGTYIRTLCDDIGKALGVGAHMISLERTRVGKFRIEESITIEELRWGNDSCHSIDAALSHMNEIILEEDLYHRAKKGQPVIPITENLSPNQYFRLKNPGKKLFGIGRVELNRIKVERLLN